MLGVPFPPAAWNHRHAGRKKFKVDDDEGKKIENGKENEQIEVKLQSSRGHSSFACDNEAGFALGLSS